MLFMSAEHVATMNSLLAASAAVQRACRALAWPRVVRYDLADGPRGEPVHWTMTFDDSVQFSLEGSAAPDLVFVGDWKQMIRASKASRSGEAADPGVCLQGDAQVLLEITPAMEVARTVATVPVQFPEV